MSRAVRELLAWADTYGKVLPDLMQVVQAVLVFPYNLQRQEYAQGD
jgi:hypothetical protein